jgi:chromosome segregation ATPase
MEDYTAQLQETIRTQAAYVEQLEDEDRKSRTLIVELQRKLHDLRYENDQLESSLAQTGRHSQDRIRDLESQVSELEYQNSNLQNECMSLRSELQRLENRVRY